MQFKDLKQSNPLLNAGYLRAWQIHLPHGPVPVSRSTWWSKVRSGEYPAGTKLSARITAWKVESVLQLLKTFETIGASAIPEHDEHACHTFADVSHVPHDNGRVA